MSGSGNDRRECGAKLSSFRWPCENPVHEGEKRCWVHGGRNKAAEVREHERAVTMLTVALYEIAHGSYRGEKHAREVALKAIEEHE